MNKVQLMGNLARDPKVSVTRTGKTLVRMTVACSETYKGRDGQACLLFTFMKEVTMYHNDYTILVKEYLNRYNEFKQYVANVEAEIEDYKEMLKLSAVPKVPSLSPAGGCGGGDGTSPQERAYFKQEDLEKRLEDSYHNLLEMLPKVRKLERSLDAMKATNHVDYRIINARYIEGWSWEATASFAGASVTYCRNEARKALRRLTGAMFGEESIPMQTHLVFIDSNKDNENCG